MDPVSALEVSYGHLSTSIANVTAEQLDGTSQCSDWDLRAMLNHVLGGGMMFTIVNQGGSAGEDAGDVLGDDPVQACAQVAAANIAAWKAPGAMEGDRTYPFGTFPAPAALMINVGEVTVHAWDVAKSTGQDATIDPEVAAMLWDFYNSIPLDAYREHGAFGPEVPVDESAPVADRMLGLIGFQP
jgi:uncharacterized protein (TIGR03086 family)